MMYVGGSGDGDDVDSRQVCNIWYNAVVMFIKVLFENIWESMNRMSIDDSKSVNVK